MKNLGRISVLAVRLSLSLALGIVFSAVLLGFMLVGSDGTEPRGICVFVNGDNGLLPLNPNNGGTHYYSCDLNISLTAFYVLVTGIMLAILIFYTPRIFLFVISFFTGR